MTAFQVLKSLQPAPLLNFIVRPGGAPMVDERDPREPAVKYACPVCGYRGLWQPPYERLPPAPYPEFGDPPYAGRLGTASLEGCHGCGYQFGYDDDPAACGAATSFRAYRRQWVAGGCRWWSSRPPPADWSPREQMRGSTPTPTESLHPAGAAMTAPAGEVPSPRYPLLPH